MSTLDRPVILTPGRTGTLLTEYAGGQGSDATPLQVINQSSERAYIGTDAGVGPSNGVPLEGGTALPWATRGQVWVVADPNAAGAVTVVASASITDWTPSPYAIAAATAARLLASGVPNVLTSETVLTSTVKFTDKTRSCPIGKYASIVISGVVGGAQLRLHQSLGGVDVVNELVTFPTLTDSSGNAVAGAVTMQCIGDTLTLEFVGGGTGTGSVGFTVQGTNRTVSRRVDSRYGADLIDRWSLPSQAFTSGTGVPMNHDTPTQSAHGEYELNAYLGNASMTAAQLVLIDGAGANNAVADTKEPGAFTGSNGNITVNKRIIVPPGATFTFLPRAGATFAPSIRLTSVDQ